LKLVESSDIQDYNIPKKANGLIICHLPALVARLQYLSSVSPWEFAGKIIKTIS
jgi:hypothetical protein